MITRRQLLAGSALLLFAPSMEASYTKPVRIHDAPFQTIAAVLADLFPGGNGIPSPRMLHVLDYLGGVFDDPWVSDDDKAFLKNGARWLDESAEEAFGKPYFRLGGIERRKVLNDVSKSPWGENWLWTVFNYFFEALLGDPVYGINTREAGWRWLGHVPGYPRPREPLCGDIRDPSFDIRNGGRKNGRFGRGDVVSVRSGDRTLRG